MWKVFLNMVLITVISLTGVSLKAQNVDSLFTSANRFYQQEDYLEALELYKKIEGQELESWSLYYNMANIYYKTNQVAPSIYYYEKALKLAPNNEDIKFNLEFANRMTLDNIEPLPKSLGQKFMEGIVLRLNYETWAKIAVGLAFIFALLFLLYHFSYSTSKKRLYFVTSGLCVIFVTTSVFFAFRNKHYVDNNTQAIIFSNVVDVKSAPTKSSELYFELHEGTKVTVLESLDNWKKIKIADGKMGWLDASSIKEI